MSLMQLMVQLGLNATGYETGIKRAESTAKKFGNELSRELGSKITSAFGFASIEQTVRKTIDWADKLKNLSIRTGIPVEELQKLEWAANQTETSIDSVVKAVEKFGKSQAAARKEGAGGEHFEAMRRMGITAEEISKVDFVTNFYKAAEHMRTTEQSAQLVADWTTVAGKSAMEIAPALREGLAGFAKELEAMGAVVPAEKMAKLAESADDFKRISVGLRTLWAEGIGNKGTSFLDEIAIALVGAAEFTRVLGTTGNLKKAHRASKEIEAEAHEGLALKHDELVQKLLGKGGADKHHPDAKTDLQTQALQKEQAAARELQRIHEHIEDIKRRSRMREMTDIEKAAQVERELAAAREEAARKRNTLLKAEDFDRIQQQALSKGKRHELEKDAALADQTVAELEDQLIQAKDKLDKGHTKKSSALKKESASSMIDIGNFLGIGDSPTRGVQEKLDVIHHDLVEIIKGTKSHAAPNPIFPES